MFRTATILVLLLWSGTASAQAKAEWIELGTRVHGGFGALIPIGIRIGLDAKQRLNIEPRGADVTFHTGEKAPCPCIVDGVAIATGASLGQGTLRVADEKAPSGLFASIVIRNRKSGEAVRYIVPGEIGPKVVEWNRSLDPSGRYDTVMSAEGLFRAEPVQGSN